MKRVVIVGGGLGGVAAALAAARLGVPCLIISECDWIGGQISSQAIPPDEHPWIEMTGSTASYRSFRKRVRDFYRSNYPLIAAARNKEALNPGLGNIGPLAHEPFVAEMVLEQILAPWRSRGLIEILRGWKAAGADVQGDRVRSVTIRNSEGVEQEIVGDYFLDATDLGDLLEVAEVEHVIGAESQAQTGELHALQGPADPRDQQAITWAMALRLSPHTDNVIPRPAQYDRWRTYQPHFWPGPMLGWQVSDYVTHESRYRPLMLNEPDSSGLFYDLWHARRVLAAEQMEGGWESDTTIAAWPMMDYWEIPLLGGNTNDTAKALQEAKEFTRSFLYWMQTEAPRHDGGTGYPELRPHGEATGTPDGLAKMPYIREGRRIQADFTVVEEHIGVAARPGKAGAERFRDSVGIGAYRMDLHPSSSGRNTLDLDSWPFEIPLGALIPVRLNNVIPAGKTMGTTHLTNGAYRVHPVEWATGEAAGALAAYCLQSKTTPRETRDQDFQLEDFQSVLSTRLDIDLHWPEFGALTPLRRFGYVQTAAS
ncbi:FAD-dependent oxidoreductase [Pseudarthrobacter sp. NPDC080039]|uniref:FAD-dependent oxidoreductase n=1 Tax=unclassified Pseudarthrobacter TaxID=2647000 RepID=UPI003451100C